MAQGYLRLGRLLDDDALRALQQHIDAIMLGAIPYLTMSFQLDGTTGEYRNLPSDTPDHKGATLAYRCISMAASDTSDHSHPSGSLAQLSTSSYFLRKLRRRRRRLMLLPLGGKAGRGSDQISA